VTVITIAHEYWAPAYRQPANSASRTPRIQAHGTSRKYHPQWLLSRTLRRATILEGAVNRELARRSFAYAKCDDDYYKKQLATNSTPDSAVIGYDYYCTRIVPIRAKLLPSRTTQSVTPPADSSDSLEAVATR